MFLWAYKVILMYPKVWELLADKDLSSGQKKVKTLQTQENEKARHTYWEKIIAEHISDKTLVKTKNSQIHNNKKNKSI